MATEPSSAAAEAEPVRVGVHHFEKIHLLGSGATGRVYLVRAVGLGPEAYYAMKIVKKSELIKRNRIERVLTEKRILSMTNHPFIATLHYAFQTADYFYLVMQYCAGGELYTFMKSQPEQCLAEEHARFYASEVLVALEYLHMMGIVYRDLKPENVLVHASGHVMLTDFDLAYEVRYQNQIATQHPDNTIRSNFEGVEIKNLDYFLPLLSPTITSSDPTTWAKIQPVRSPRQGAAYTKSIAASPRGSRQHNNASIVAGNVQYPPIPMRRPRRCSCPCTSQRVVTYPVMDTESHLDDCEKLTSFVGTHEYVAPEIVNEQGYTGAVDWWAFGVFLYEMLYGTTPFRAATQRCTLEKIAAQTNQVSFPTHLPVSSEAEDLIRRLLTKSAPDRLQNPLAIKSHPFFGDVVWPCTSMKMKPAWKLVIRHQKPPILPAQVASPILDAEALSPDEIDPFGDDVDPNCLGHGVHDTIPCTTSISLDGMLDGSRNSIEESKKSSSMPSCVMNTNISRNDDSERNSQGETTIDSADSAVDFEYVASPTQGRYWHAHELYCTFSPMHSLVDDGAKENHREETTRSPRQSK